MILKPKTKNLTNQKFGKWEVIRFHGYIKRNAHWFCRCECGLEKTVKAQYLLSGDSNSCVNCCNIRASHQDEISPAIWGYVVSRAKRKCYELTITRDFAWGLFIEQNRKCALTGMELYIPVNASEYLERKGTASLDRINSDEGYVVGNVQWVHKDVNRMKNIYSQDYFLHICRLIAKNHPITSSSVCPLTISRGLP